MADRDARNRLTNLLQRYRSDELTGDALLSSFPTDCGDTAVLRIAGRCYDVLIGGGHGRGLSDPALRLLLATELPKHAYFLREIDRSVLFLQTDLDYRWRDYPVYGDPTLGPFQLLAFLIGIPLLAYPSQVAGDTTRWWGSLLCVLYFLALIPATLLGGSRLRSLFTGIDRFVWPFYRRQDYRAALAGLRE